LKTHVIGPDHGREQFFVVGFRHLINPGRIDHAAIRGGPAAAYAFKIGL
jgi:hypothetical protein